MTRLGLIPLLLLGLAGCPKRELPPVETDAQAAAAVDAGADGGEDVEPVYKIDKNAPVDPLADKLCRVLNLMPEQKRAACCSTTPGIVVMELCAPTLTAAMKAKAIELAAADVDACEAAFGQTLAGCDWVGPFPPGAPERCKGIVKGKLAAGATCRSSLECAGNQRCLGSGPTTKGTCGPVKNDGDLCGGTVDPLAGFLRQTDLDKQHPECRDRCIKHKCASAVAESGECQTTADCQAGLQCLPGAPGAKPGAAPKKKCVAGKLPGKDGEACPGGECETGLSCIRGKCTVRKAGGEACTDDFECKGGCLRGDAGKGTCGPRCDIR